MFCLDYKENADEIKIETSGKESELRRGWIGDLYYSTGRSRNIVTGANTDLFAEKTYEDVLLAKVNILSINDRVVWEYTFLKK